MHTDLVPPPAARVVLHAMHTVWQLGNLTSGVWGPHATPTPHMLRLVYMMLPHASFPLRADVEPRSAKGMLLWHSLSRLNRQKMP